MQGKRVVSEEGAEGYSDLYQENAMLQRENDTLRLRVKAMQETIDHLNTRVTHMLANEISTLLNKSSMLKTQSYFYLVVSAICVLGLILNLTPRRGQ